MFEGLKKNMAERAVDRTAKAGERKRRKMVDSIPAELFDGLDKSRPVYTQGGQMGQNITLGDMKRDMMPGQIVSTTTGFWTPKPTDGDYLKVHMSSGNWGMFKFTGLNAGWTADRDQHPFGPEDYFEGSLIWLGYEQELGNFNRDTITFD